MSLTADLLLARHYMRVQSAPGTCPKCGGDGLDCGACEQRGGRCVRCDETTRPDDLEGGLCQSCQDRVAEGEGPRLCGWCGAGTHEDGSLGDCLCPACRASVTEDEDEGEQD